MAYERDDFIASIRKRPGMYLGATETGEALHNMVFAVAGEGVAECLAGHATRITITLNPDGSCMVQDDGRGIAWARTFRGEEIGPEVVLTNLVVPDSDRITHDPDLISIIGLCPVNALSDWVEVCTWTEGKGLLWRFVEGRPLASPAPLEATSPTSRSSAFTFQPSRELFPSVEFDLARIRDWAASVMERYPAVVLTVEDARRP